MQNQVRIWPKFGRFVSYRTQLENKDPEKQPFYEQVDLAYTIIFALGES